MAETCDSFCTSCGRGHVHYVQCDKGICTSALHDGARHSKRQFAGRRGNILDELDEYSHEFHWQQMGFEDPVKTADELRAFRMCGSYCMCEEHEQVRASLAIAWRNDPLRIDES